MARRTRNTSTAANLGFEATLWAAADKLRSNMDAAEYKHVVLGLIFLKYISDAFEEQPRPARDGTRAGRRPRRPRRIPRPRTSSGCRRRPAGHTCKARAKQPAHRQADRRRHGRHRARQPLAQGRAAQGLCPARPGQAAPGRADRPDRHHRPGRRREPLQGHPGPRLRVLPRPVRQRRRQEGRPVLHAALRRPAAGGDARAVQGPRLRPLLRLGRHVCAVARSSSRRTAASVERHHHLRPGVQPHHLAAGQDEPGHPRHRRPIWPTATASTTTCTRT